MCVCVSELIVISLLNFHDWQTDILGREIIYLVTTGKMPQRRITKMVENNTIEKMAGVFQYYEIDAELFVT